MTKTKEALEALDQLQAGGLDAEERYNLFKMIREALTNAPEVVTIGTSPDGYTLPDGWTAAAWDASRFHLVSLSSAPTNTKN